MTPQEMEAEIRNLQEAQATQRKHWRRFGYASLALSLAIWLAIGARMVLTGATPEPQMLLIDLLFVFVGSALLTTGRTLRQPAGGADKTRCC